MELPPFSFLPEELGGGVDANMMAISMFESSTWFDLLADSATHYDGAAGWCSGERDFR